MSQDRPERPPIANVLEALEVKRNAAIGLAVGVGFTALVYLFFVAIPGQTSAYYLALAFVLALTASGTVAIALTVYSAIGLSREL